MLTRRRNGETAVHSCIYTFGLVSTMPLLRYFFYAFVSPCCFIVLIQSFGLDIIGVREEKRGSKIRPDQEQELWTFRPVKNRQFACFVSRDKKKVSSLNGKEKRDKKTCHVLGMFSQAEQSHLPCFFIRNLLWNDWPQISLFTSRVIRSHKQQYLKKFSKSKAKVQWVSPLTV